MLLLRVRDMVALDAKEISRGVVDNKLSGCVFQGNADLVEGCAQAVNLNDAEGVARDGDDALRALYSASDKGKNRTIGTKQANDSTCSELKFAA